MTSSGKGADPNLNRVIAGYRLLQPAGKGGMGTVYFAREESSGKTYAFKILKPDLASNEKQVRRFMREARIIGGLDHPHIIKVRAAGEEDGLFYIVMEFISGWTLVDLIRNQWIKSVDNAVQIAEQIALALAAAHEHGVIHRDVKPHNIMMTKDMRVRLTDFGLAKETSSETTSLTSTGNILGTPIYMAPEQWRGDPPTPQTDIYALGVLLYEMLTGKAPFNSETPHSLMLHALHDQLPPASNVNPKVDSALDRIIYDMTAIDPAKRYKSASALADDLRAYRKGELHRESHGYVMDSGIIKELIGTSARQSPPVSKPDRIEVAVSATKSLTKGLALIALIVASIGVLLFGLAKVPAMFEGFRDGGHPDEAGFQSIFNGNDFAGWTGDMDGYSIENSILSCSSRNNIYTVTRYSDFILRLEFRLTSGANNGIAIRSPMASLPVGFGGMKSASALGLEIAIGDDNKGIPRWPWETSGSIYGVAPAQRGHLKPAGEWNYEEITANGRRITVNLNGAIILDVDLDEITQYGPADRNDHPGIQNKSGNIGFLGHTPRVDFRNIRIKTLDHN